MYIVCHSVCLSVRVSRGCQCHATAKPI